MKQHLVSLSFALALAFGFVAGSFASAQSATFRDTCVPPMGVIHGHRGVDADFDCLVDSDPGGPVIGQIWVSAVVILAGDVASFLYLSNGPLPCTPAPGFFTGSFLCVPSPILTDVAAGVHCIPIPNQVSLIGLSLCSQGGSIGLGPFEVTLSNALDLVIG